MENHTNFRDSWEQAGWEVPTPPFSENSDEIEEEIQGWETSSKSLYDTDETNEPYFEPEMREFEWTHKMLLRLMPGPSTNFYVGPKEKHYTIPKRLLYQFSEYPEACLERGFLEAGANAVRLSDVDADVFQYLWQWLYTGELEIFDGCTFSLDRSSSEVLVQACQLLCRVHMLGERLLFDDRFLKRVVQSQLDEVMKKAKTDDEHMPLTPEVVEEVLSDSALVQYEVTCNPEYSLYSERPSLRPFVLRHLCSFQFCTTVDFRDYAHCFENDGAFAAEIMVFLASEIKWAKDRSEEQVGWPVEVFRDEEQGTEEPVTEEQVTEEQVTEEQVTEEQVTEDQGSPRCTETMTKLEEGFWVVLSRICTSVECSATDVRAFSNLFELNGVFAAEFLNHMATVLLLIVERWGEELGEEVDFLAEKEEEERIAQEKRDLDRFVEKIMRRDGWS